MARTITTFRWWSYVVVCYNHCHTAWYLVSSGVTMGLGHHRKETHRCFITTCLWFYIFLEVYQSGFAKEVLCHNPLLPVLLDHVLTCLEPQSNQLQLKINGALEDWGAIIIIMIIISIGISLYSTFARGYKALLPIITVSVTVISLHLGPFATGKVHSLRL